MFKYRQVVTVRQTTNNNLMSVPADWETVTTAAADSPTSVEARANHHQVLAISVKDTGQTHKLGYHRLQWAKYDF